MAEVRDESKRCLALRWQGEASRVLTGELELGWWWAVRYATVRPLEDQGDVVAVPPDLDAMFVYPSVMELTKRAEIVYLMGPATLTLANVVNITPPRRTPTPRSPTPLISGQNCPTVPHRHGRIGCPNIKRHAFGV